MIVLVLLVAVVAAVWLVRSGRVPGLPGVVDRETTIARMLDGEMLIFDLNAELRKLSKSMTNLRLPDARARTVFATSVQVVDLGTRAPGEADFAASGLGVRIGAWADRTAPGRRTRDELDLWRPFLDGVESWDWGKFYFQNARFLDAAKTRFASQVGFKGRARLTDGSVCGVEAHQAVLWTREGVDDGGKPRWTIAGWSQEDFRLLASADLPFEDVAARLFPDPRARARAVLSLHERHLYDLILQLRKPESERTGAPPHRYFFPAAQDHHPAVAIVDLDGDGWDDVYLCVQWGPNQLFRNRGDGTFEEVAARWGLDVPEHSSSALFADYDGDGDLDVFVGRTLSPSLYLVNESGRFVDRSGSWTGGALPSLVSSITAADADGDGRLDVYFGTYASDLMRSTGNLPSSGLPIGSSEPGEQFLGEFLTAEDSAELRRRHADGSWHAFKNAAGPPNVFLRGMADGRFEPDPGSALRVWRHTYQATWGDYDNDGDPDLYVANDFAPNELFENRKGSFVDVTAATGTADIGFGMGATWGDYDGDGRQDLYVTNMYSKAGNRILAQLPWIDPALRQMARGNTLFRNAASGPWPKVSGTGPGSMQVEYAEWSWGSQFVDLDQDGWLDLYAPNGHYTPPREVQAEVDL